MKNITLIVVLLAVIASLSFSDTTVTIKEETTFTGTPTMDLFIANQHTFVYALVSQNWSEAYAGLKYSPAPWIEVAIGAGTEQAPDSFRYGGWVWVGKDRLSALHLFENGGTGRWHKTTVNYQATPDLSVGLIDRKYFGRGATAEYNLGKGIKANVAAYENGRKTLALSYTF